METYYFIVTFLHNDINAEHFSMSFNAGSISNLLLKSNAWIGITFAKSCMIDISFISKPPDKNIGFDNVY